MGQGLVRSVRGPEHNAFAKAEGAELRAIVNCVNRGNNYLLRPTGPGTRRTATGRAIFKGKNIAVVVCLHAQLDCSAAPAGEAEKLHPRDRPRANLQRHVAASSKQVQIGQATELFVTQGIEQSGGRAVLQRAERPWSVR